MPILYDESTRVFKLDAKDTTYAIHLSKTGHLLHLYFGKAVPDVDLVYLLRMGDNEFVPATHDAMGPFSFDCTMLEYPTSGIGDFREPCLQVMDKDGMSACEIVCTSHKIYKGKPKITGLPATFANSDDDCTTLELYCKDEHLNLEVTLIYTVFEQLNVITRSVRLRNASKDDVNIRRVLSTCVDFDGMDYDMLTLHGTWARERHIQRNPLHFGKQGIDSCRGMTSHAHNNFAAMCSHDCTEDTGEVYGFGFVYSGSFFMSAEVNQYEKTRMVVGLNPYDFNWLLEPNEEFETPETVMVYSDEGLGKMSRTFHDLYRSHLTRGKHKDMRRPILINNWEATYFDFDTDKLIQIAKEASGLGIEMLVMDDGWFGKRSDDRSSLGDWIVNEDKIKGGLKYLVDEVNKCGLKFGIWFEPEMISPDSDLYRAHPDWAIHVKGRVGTQARSQLVLDFSRKDVRDYIYGQMHDILSSANIEYVKWDCNRQISELGNEVLPANRQREIWHRYNLGVYEVMERLLTDFPDLLLENCAGGGGRYDAGMLYYSPQIWTSDDADPIERLKIQYGTSMCYPCSSMGAHVADSPNHIVGRHTPFKTRGDVAMVGTFGYELDVTRISQEDKDTIKEQIAQFNKYNPLIRTGDHYRIGNPFKSTRFDAWMFVAKDKSEALLEFVQILKSPAQFTQRLKLRGLDANAFYRDEATGKVYSAKALMNAGYLIPSLWGDFHSFTAHFTKL